MERQKCIKCGKIVTKDDDALCGTWEDSWHKFDDAVPSQLEKVTANLNKQAQLYGAEEVPNAIPPQVEKPFINAFSPIADRDIKKINLDIEDSEWEDTQPTIEWLDDRLSHITKHDINGFQDSESDYRNCVTKDVLKGLIVKIRNDYHENVTKENEVGQGLTRSEYVRLKAFHQDDVSNALKKQREGLIVKTSGMARVVGEGIYCVTCKKRWESGDCSCIAYNQALSDVLEVLKDNNK